MVAARVSESGALLDASPMILAATAELDRAPRVVGGPPGEALVPWDAFSEPWGNFRALGRFVGDGDAGDAGDAGNPDAGDASSSDGGGAQGPVRTYGVGCTGAEADGLCALGLLVLARRRTSRVALGGRGAPAGLRRRPD